MAHDWQIIDQGLSVIGKTPSFLKGEDKLNIALAVEK
jgi:hypothetical protein